MVASVSVAGSMSVSLGHRKTSLSPFGKCARGAGKVSKCCTTQWPGRGKQWRGELMPRHLPQNLRQEFSSSTTVQCQAPAAPAPVASSATLPGEIVRPHPGISGNQKIESLREAAGNLLRVCGQRSLTWVGWMRMSVECWHCLFTACLDVDVDVCGTTGSRWDDIIIASLDPSCCLPNKSPA